MRLSIPRNFIVQLLFALCVVVPTFNNYELTFATWTLVALFTLRKKYSVPFLLLIVTAVAILTTGFFSAFFNDARLYEYIRDITYLAKPILGLLIGYQLCRRSDNSKPFNTIVMAGVLLAVIHMVMLAVGVLFYKIRDIHQLRLLAGYFSDYEVYALVILIFSRKFGVDFLPRTKLLIGTLLAVSILFYFARTNFIQFGILVVAILGYFRITKRSLKAVFSISIVVILAYSAIVYSNPRRSATGFEAFLYKIKIAPIEPFKTRINEEDWKDFNDNYRSFENIITVEQVTRDGLFPTVFGKGLGSNVDLGREIWTNDGEYIRFLPALHNSYMTIFLKSGLVGVFFMLLFIYYLMRYRRSTDPQITAINFLILGTAVFLILSNWVFMGLYFKVDNKAILIGFLFAYREILRREERLNKLIT